MANPLAQLGKAVSNPRGLARRAIQNSDWLETLIQGLESDTARTKYGCAKALRIISETRPEVIYPHFDFFVRLLSGDNRILQWEALFVLSQVAGVDKEDRFAAVFNEYFSPVPGPVMITAANAIRGGARIARAKPALADRIAAEILKVEQARYQTRECRDVAVGHAIIALGEILDLVSHPEPLRGFVRRQAENARPATRKKAGQVLKQIQRREKGSAA
jgi:hypothetical protein